MVSGGFDSLPAYWRRIERRLKEGIMDMLSVNLKGAHVRYVSFHRGALLRECEWTMEQAYRSIGSRVELGFDVTSRIYTDRDGRHSTVVYFTALNGEVWSVYAFMD